MSGLDSAKDVDDGVDPDATLWHWHQTMQLARSQVRKRRFLFAACDYRVALRLSDALLGKPQQPPVVASNFILTCVEFAFCLNRCQDDTLWLEPYAHRRLEESAPRSLTHPKVRALLEALTRLVKAPDVAPLR